MEGVTSSCYCHLFSVKKRVTSMIEFISKEKYYIGGFLFLILGFNFSYSYVLRCSQTIFFYFIGFQLNIKSKFTVYKVPEFF